MWSTKKLAIASAVSLALTGCIDLPGSDDDDEPSSSLTGKAADGYLGSANVCLDLNNNKVCDRGEPSATTGPDGDFTINADESQIESATLLVEIIAGVTVDKDNPNTPVDKAYSLSAPAGYKFISPITTLVQAEVEKSGGSVEDAEDALKARLGTEIDFEDDYVAGQEDDENSADHKAAYEELHKVARVIATIMKNNLDNVDVDQDSENFEDVIKLVISKVEVALETIKAAVENDDSGTFDPETIAANEDVNNSTKVDAETLADEIALQEDLAAATDANMGTKLAEGLWWVEYHFDHDAVEPEIGYGKTSFNGTTTSNMFYYWNGTQFVLDTDNGTANVEAECTENCDNHVELLLTANGWTEANFDEGDEGEGPTFTGTSGDSVLMDMGPIQVKLDGEEFDLTGNNIRGTLSGTGDWEWAGLVTSTTDFGTDSKGYKLRMSVANDVFIMPDFTDDCTLGENDEDQSNIVGNCNLMRFINAPGDSVGDGDPTSIQADTFNPIVTTRGTSDNPLDYKGIILGFDDGDDDGVDTGFIAEFGSDNKIFYYKVVVSQDEIQSFEKVLEAPYEQTTVHGKSLIVFDVPFKLGIPFFDDHDEECSDCTTDGSTTGEESCVDCGSEDDRGEGPKPTALFLTAHEGYWRYGFAIEAGTPIPDDAPFVYNEAAMDSITGAFDSSLIPTGSGSAAEQ